ncbi:silencing information regulator [Histoplasma capsulatum var. duboisii H88]|nr:silencing information regulator [Histoplasma capsulatum var. duboisii H88]
MSREDFQAVLLRLNPAWAEFLEQIAKTGALDTHDREEQQKKGLQMNPDGDVDLPNAPYSKFRYPPCPHCLENPPLLRDGTQGIVEAEPDGAISPTSNAGILKPAVIMFGESVDERVKEQAEDAVDEAGKLLVLGSSLATFSAWRFVERAIARGMSIGILNVGGVRNEARLFQEADGNGFIDPTMRVRCSERAEFVLPQVAAHLDPISLA